MGNKRKQVNRDNKAQTVTASAFFYSPDGEAQQLNRHNFNPDNHIGDEKPLVQTKPDDFVFNKSNDSGENQGDYTGDNGIDIYVFPVGVSLEAGSKKQDGQGEKPEHSISHKVVDGAFNSIRSTNGVGTESADEEHSETDNNKESNA